MIFRVGTRKVERLRGTCLGGCPVSVPLVFVLPSLDGLHLCLLPARSNVLVRFIVV